MCNRTLECVGVLFASWVLTNFVYLFFSLFIVPEKVTSNVTAVLMIIPYLRESLVSRTPLSLLLTGLLELALTCGQRRKEHLPQRLLRELCPSLMLKTSSLIKNQKKTLSETVREITCKCRRHLRSCLIGLSALKWVCNQWHKNRDLFWNLAKQR